MFIKSSPLAVSIAFGLVCGLVFTPLVMLLSLPLSLPVAFRATIWVFVVMFCLIMIPGQSGQLARLVFPLLTLLAAAVWVTSPAGYLLLAIGVLGWVRITADSTGTKNRWPAELIVDAAAAVWLLVFEPRTFVLWPLAVCGFFLIQAAYFIILKGADKKDAAGPVDPFERARRNAEKILYG